MPTQIGQLVSQKGQVSITRDGQTAPAQLGDPVYATDVVTTGNESAATLGFADNTRLSMGPDQTLDVKALGLDDSDKCKTCSGGGDGAGDPKGAGLTRPSGLLNMPPPSSGAPGGMKIKVPTAILGVSG